MNDKLQPKDKGSLSRLFRRKDNTVSVNLDRLKKEDKEAVLDAMVTKTEFTKYEGEVEYGYDLKYAKEHSVCPKCNSELQQHYGNFIYATQTSTRVMFAPAGYFCTVCPTVVIDQDILRKGVTENYMYQGVLGIDGVKGERAGLFKTWNDKKVIYFVDGERMIMGFEETKDTFSSRKRAIENDMIKKRNKKKLEKLSKRKNRAKK